MKKKIKNEKKVKKMKNLEELWIVIYKIIGIIH